MKLLLLCTLLAQLPPAAPRIVELASGDYLVPRAAFLLLDEEMKRLQAVEKQHRSESWAATVLVSSGVGLVVGVVAGVLAALAVGQKAQASPSP